MAEPIARSSLTGLAVDALLRHIEERGLAPGDPLGSTAQLAGELQVSRTVVREAIAELAGQGLLVRRQGRETVVSQPDAGHLERLLRLRFAVTGADYHSLSEYRDILEVASARLAAERATVDQIREISQCLDRLDTAGPDEEAQFRADQAFHLSIARASGNEMLHLGLESTTGLLIELRRRTWRGWIGSGRSEAQVHEAHTAIFEAISDHDPDGAEQAMRLNLEQARIGLAELSGVAAAEGFALSLKAIS